MLEDSYFACYTHFNTTSKKEAAALIGADNLVGDCFSIEFKTDDGVITAWIKNRFGAALGYLDPDMSRRLSILHARDFTLTALLSYVAFTSTPEPGHYWGEVAIVAMDSKLAEVKDAYLHALSAKLQDGVRPDIALGQQGVQHIVENEGNWVPKQTVSMPKDLPNTVILKSHRKVSEKLIEQGRKGNVGCYIVSWAFLLALVTGCIFGLKACGAF